MDSEGLRLCLQNPPSVAIMSQLKPLPSLRSILVLYSHLRLDLLSGLFQQSFRTSEPLLSSIEATDSGYGLRHSVFLDCGWRRRPTGTETSFQSTEQAVVDSRQWVSSQFAGWTRS
jgi:hypothetical protein